MRRAGFFLVWAAAVVPLGADEQKAPERVEMGRAPQAQPSAASFQIKLPPAKPSPEPGVAAAPELQTTRALAVEAGEARLTVDGQPLTVHAGDSLGTAVVKSIVPGRLVLQRAAAGSDGDLLLVGFDAQGRPHVRAFTATPPQIPSAPTSTR